MVKKTAQGFTLIELLVVIAIIAVLAAVVMTQINPFQIQMQSRDTTRLADLRNLTNAINIAIQDATSSGAPGVLCHNTTVPCQDTSNSTSANVRKNDGSGWVKVNLSGQRTVTMPTLPVDPMNDATYHYSYATNNAGDKYELDAVLESDKYKPKMAQDGGNNDNVYEQGTDYTILP